MTDFSSLQLKVNDLKAKIAQNSITPIYLGSLLQDFLDQISDIDTDLSSDLSTALNRGANALIKAAAAAEAATNAQTTADSARASALNALDQISGILNSVGKANGIASLDNRGFLKASQLPAYASPQSVTVSQLDTMGTDGSAGAMLMLVANDEESPLHTRYAVLDEDGWIVGVLDILTTSGACVLSQRLTSHASLKADGSINWNSHRDSVVHTYVRSYNFSSGETALEAARGQWTKWKEYIPEPLKALQPVKCTDEADLAQKIDSGLYPENQIYYIEEED